MKLLILGGAGLSGTAITLAALQRGHDVVAVHRVGSGTLAQVVHPRLTEFVRNRAHGHAGLEQLGPFDGIIDVSARVPAIVADAVITLDAPHTHWVQVSSGSAYADVSVELREGAALAHFDDPALEARANRELDIQLGWEHYSAAKANCERMLARGVRDSAKRVTILRPVLITGAYDDTLRFPYWVERIARGGVALAPPADGLVQLVDARDQAEFVLRCVEQRIAGSYNLAAPLGSTTFRDVVEAVSASVRALGAEPARVVHAPAGFLAEHGVEPWSDLPAWLPSDSPARGMVQAHSDRARGAGYVSRPLADTVAAVHEWLLTDPTAIGRVRAGIERPGLDPAREVELLARLDAPQLQIDIPATT
ncbi:MAG: epimerase [Thermoleophilia bacterium]|nr:epimerase [Thermoleophilia bacterium]